MSHRGQNVAAHRLANSAAATNTATGTAGALVMATNREDDTPLRPRPQQHQPLVHDDHPGPTRPGSQPGQPAAAARPRSHWTRRTRSRLDPPPHPSPHRFRSPLPSTSRPGMAHPCTVSSLGLHGQNPRPLGKAHRQLIEQSRHPPIRRQDQVDHIAHRSLLTNIAGLSPAPRPYREARVSTTVGLRRACGRSSLQLTLRKIFLTGRSIKLFWA
jgi:hypothetical protein